MNELKPCPKCNDQVSGHLCGGPAAFGCTEYEYEAECKCGLTFTHTCRSEESGDAEREGIEAWNTRYKRTCTIEYQVSTGFHLEDDVISLSCGHEVYGTVKGWHPRFCEACGAEVVNDR